MGKVLVLVLVAVSWVTAAIAQDSTVMPRQDMPRQDGVRAFGRLPVYFVENDGLLPEVVKYFVRGADKSLYFTPTGVTFSLHSSDLESPESWAVKLDFLTDGEGVAPVGRGPSGAAFSQFVGPRRTWITGLECFSCIVYRELWPGIDLEYRGTVNRLKYSFHVRPGADPSRIRLRYRGATGLRVTESGALRVETPVHSFEDARPVAYQTKNGRPVAVETTCSLAADGTIGFELGEYDPELPLILDPAVLLYCGLIGGSNTDRAEAVAVDDHGNVYVTGSAISSAASFPTRTGPFVTKTSGPDVFVTKVNPSGTALVYSGFIGGSGGDQSYGIDVDASGCAYVCGDTQSDEKTFPVKVGPGLSMNRNLYTADGFVAKIAASGRDLVYCGYLGNGIAFPNDLAVDAAGAVYLTGGAGGLRPLPGKIGPDRTYNGGPGDGFVAKVQPSGAALVYAGFIGGAAGDEGHSIAVDAAGAAYVTGTTTSDEKSFPVRIGPDLTFNGVIDAFVAKVHPNGTSLVYAGYLGGSGEDRGHGIAVDGTGSAYLTGATKSDQASFPVVVGPDLTYNGGTWDAYVAKLDASGRSLSYCGYVGGSADDLGTGVAFDSTGRVYIVGNTTSADLPLRNGPTSTFSGNVDAFVARIAATGLRIDLCGYIGGRDRDLAMDVVVGPTDAAYVAGEAFAVSTFPVKTGPITTYSKTYDAFVAKVGCTHLLASGASRPGSVVKLDLTALDSPGLPCQFGSSFGNGPLPIGGRKLGLSVDPLLQVSVGGLWPGVFRNYAGRVSGSGKAQAAIAIPAIHLLVGLTIHTAAVTWNPQAPHGVQAIANTVSLTIVP